MSSLKYKEVHDETYKRKDISIYTMADGTFIADVKKPCGELIAGWDCLENFESALWTAREFIAASGGV
jgi:hypothetical protein